MAKLPCGPGGRGVRGDRHMDEASAIVREDDQDEEQPERHRRHDEQVGRHDLVHVAREERPPRL